jgi:dTDP-4-dehydrorhamnose 3,5-epimerase
VGRQVCVANSRDDGDLLKLISTPLKDAYVLELVPNEDERGIFARTFCKEEFKKFGLSTEFVQQSTSYNRKKGTLRGMHFQKAPHAEIKLVRCTRGAFFDVIVDLRPDSPTFKQHFSIELSADNRKTVYIPEGFAHGFQTLTDDAEIFYQMSVPFNAASASGARWNDPAFGIKWPQIENRIISDKDSNYPNF